MADACKPFAPFIRLTRIFDDNLVAIEAAWVTLQRMGGRSMQHLAVEGVSAAVPTGTDKHAAFRRQYRVPGMGTLGGEGCHFVLPDSCHQKRFSLPVKSNAYPLAWPLQGMETRLLEVKEYVPVANFQITDHQIFPAAGGSSETEKRQGHKNR